MPLDPNKFGDSSLKGWWVMVKTSSVLAHTHAHTHAHAHTNAHAADNNTWRPKQASGKKYYVRSFSQVENLFLCVLLGQCDMKHGFKYFLPASNSNTTSITSCRQANFKHIIGANKKAWNNKHCQTFTIKGLVSNTRSSFDIPLPYTKITQYLCPIPRWH